MTNKIDWNDNAKAAVKEFAMYIGEVDASTDFIATRPKDPERKTVYDAVRTVLTGFEGDSLYYSPSRSTWYGSSGPIPQDFYQVCTREEFEKARGEKESEWTHITNSGQKCKIHVSEPDANGIIIVINSHGEYMRHSADSLKPIKPTITKAEAWDRVINRNEKVSYITNGFTITD